MDNSYKTMSFEQLKEFAKKEKISHSPNISIDTLLEKIGLELAQRNKPESMGKLRARKLKEAKQQFRIQVTPRDKLLSKVGTTMIKAGNCIIGTHGKAITFNEPIHVSLPIYNALKEAKTAFRFTKVNSKGEEYNEVKVVNKFDVIDLPALTPEELKGLAEQQKMKKASTDSVT